MSKIVWSIACLCFSLIGTAEANRLDICTHLLENPAPTVLIGWYHGPENHELPDLLIEELAQIKAPAQVDLVMEWPAGAVVQAPSDERQIYLKVSKTDFLKVVHFARGIGVNVVAGDLNPAYGPATIENRDRFFAQTIERSIRIGRKVIVWVGTGHLRGIARQLRALKIPFLAIPTEFDAHRGLIFTKPGDCRRGLAYFEHPDEDIWGKISAPVRLTTDEKRRLLSVLNNLPLFLNVHEREDWLKKEAYSFFQMRGPDGSPEEDWQRAKIELRRRAEPLLLL